MQYGFDDYINSTVNLNANIGNLTGFNNDDCHNINETFICTNVCFFDWAVYTTCPPSCNCTTDNQYYQEEQAIDINYISVFFGFIGGNPFSFGIMFYLWLVLTLAFIYVVIVDLIIPLVPDWL